MGGVPRYLNILMKVRIMKRSNDKFLFYGLVLWLLAIYPISAMLPGWASFENGPIENAQAGVLFLFSGMCLLFYCNQSLPHRKMWLPSAGVFLILAGRELSWGRVFFTTGYDPESGPIVISASDMPFYTEIHVMVGVFAVLCLVGLIRWVPWKQIFRDIPVPWMRLVMLIICVILVTLGDHHSMFHTIRDQMIEELAELLMYLQLGEIAWYYRQRIKE